MKSVNFEKNYSKCEVCALVKNKKSISQKAADRYVYGKGSFYYVDFSGPFEVLKQGIVYMVLFVNRYTRLIVGFFVKKKKEDTAIELIRQFIKENLTAPMFREQDFVFLQSDNVEFYSKKVRLYSWANGIFNIFPAHIIV